MNYFFDYYNYEYKNYPESITALSKESHKAKLMVGDTGLKYATRFEVVVETIKGWLGFENKTDVIKVNLELLKMLHYGQTYHYMENKEVVKAVNALVSNLKDKNGKISQAVQACLNAINTPAVSEEQKEARLRKMQEAIRLYYNRHEIRLQNAFWTEKFRDETRFDAGFNPPKNFGDTYIKLAQNAEVELRYSVKTDYSSAWAYYKKAGLFVMEELQLREFLRKIKELGDIDQSKSKIPFLEEMLEKAIKNKLFDSAIAICLCIIQTSPNEENYILLVNLYLQTDHNENCFKILDNHLNKSKKSLDIRKKLAERFEFTTDPDLQIEHLKKAEKLLRGIDIEARGRIILKLTTLIDWKPSWCIRFWLGEQKLKKEEALAVILNFLKDLKNSKSKSIDLEKVAERLMEIAQLIKPSHPKEAYDCFSYVHQSLPDRKQDDFFNLIIRLEKYRKAWTVNPQKCENYALKIVEVYCKSEKFKKAYEVVLKFPEKKYSSANRSKIAAYFNRLLEKNYNRGLRYAKEKKHEAALQFNQKALEFSQKALKVLPSEKNNDKVSQMERKVGDAYVALNRLDLAKESYKSSLKMESEFDPYLRDSLFNLANNYLKEVEQQIEIYLEETDVYDNQSREKHQTSDPIIKAKNESLKALQDAIDILNLTIDNRYSNKIDKNLLKEIAKLLAKLYFTKGEILEYFYLPGKLELFESALKHNPQNAWYQLKVYELYSMQENKKEMERAWKKLEMISVKGVEENFSTLWIHYCDERFLKEKILSKELDIHA